MLPGKTIVVVKSLFSHFKTIITTGFFGVLQCRGIFLIQFQYLLTIDTFSKTLFTWSGGPRSGGVGFFCFVSPGA